MTTIRRVSTRAAPPKPKPKASLRASRSVSPLKLFQLECSTQVGPFSVFFDAEGKVYACNWTEFLDRMKESVRKMWKLSSEKLVLIEKDATTLSVSDKDTREKLQREFLTHFEEYFASRVPTEQNAILSNITLAYPPTLPHFTKTVWDTCRREVTSGKALSYGELAVLAQGWESGNREVGPGLAARAVGAAMGANPYVVVMPCHRVVRANKSLHGYGCGLFRKVWLLRHERCPIPEKQLKAAEKVRTVHIA